MQRRFLLIAIAAVCFAGLILYFGKPSHLVSVISDMERWQRLIQPYPTRVAGYYLAPLLDCDPPKRVANEYLVFLRYGWSLEQHKMIVGDEVDLASAITYAFVDDSEIGFFDPHTPFGHYHAAHLGAAGLDAVRGETGVDLVKCVRRAYLF